MAIFAHLHLSKIIVHGRGTRLGCYLRLAVPGWWFAVAFESCLFTNTCLCLHCVVYQCKSACRWHRAGLHSRVGGPLFSYTTTSHFHPVCGHVACVNSSLCDSSQHICVHFGNQFQAVCGPVPRAKTTLRRRPASAPLQVSSCSRCACTFYCLHYANSATCPSISARRSGTLRYRDSEEV